MTLAGGSWEGIGKHRIETLSAKDATVEFLRQLLKDYDLPDEIIIGEPAVREDKWKENFRRHVREVFDTLNLPNPRFFPEPFAVFQYYREYEKIFPAKEEPEIVLIIDYGGTTFNSCIIRTTEMGHLARGGATAVPLGLQAGLSGGYELDKALLCKAVQKARRKKLAWKEDPIARAENHPLVLLLTEDAKIQLSEAIGTKARLSGDFSSIKKQVLFPKGTLHPDQEIDVEFTGEDLKDVIRKMWRRTYGHLLISTVEEARKRLKDAAGVELTALDKVLIAGGSSWLPFMSEEIATVFPTMVRPQDIFVGNDLGTSVAFGIACECKDQAKRNPALKLNTMAPCLLNDLFLGFRLTRRDIVVPAKIRTKGSVSADGRLLASPFETETLSFDFDFEFPHEIQEHVFYCFSDRPFSQDQISYLNLCSDVFLVNTNKSIVKRAKLILDIKKNGMCQPTFYLKEKGKGAKKEPHMIQCPEFCLEDFKILEGSSFLGIDFGASNSYVARLVSSDTESWTASEYPEFEIGPATKESLRQLEVQIDVHKQEGMLEPQSLLRHARRQALHIVFHSNKIEGNPLTLGETELVLRGKNKKTHLSENEKSASNLEASYRWMLKHRDSCKNEPEGFIRHLNGSILEGIKAGGGQYRSQPVALSGMNYTPPNSSFVPGFMQLLSEEIKRGIEGRSPLEFATSIHTKLVWIHPFSDGNGRTARLLLNSLLLIHGVPAIIVNFDDRERYLEAISQSNDGNLSALVTLFTEYVYEQLEQLGDQHTKPSPKAESSVAVKQVIAEDPIAQAIEQVEVHEEKDPLAATMETKILTIQKETEITYEAWKLSFLALRQEFKAIVEEFNSTTKYRKAGFHIHLKEFDILSFEKHSTIRHREKVSRTWFLGCEIIGPRTQERFILFFGHGSPDLCRAPNLDQVALHIARYADGGYNRLISEPIRLREIGYCAGELAFLRMGGAIQIGNVNEELRMLFADVIRAYF